MSSTSRERNHAHSFRSYDWAGATAMVDGALASYSLDDSLAAHLARPETAHAD